MELKNELDDRGKELDEIKNWTAALKQRYDTILQEKNEIMNKQHETFENLSLSRNNVTDMDIRVKRLTREVTELKKEREKRDNETVMLKSQVNSEHHAYVKATEKVEEVKAYFNELIESKEKELSEKIEFVGYLQEEVEDLKRDLVQTKEELSVVLDGNDDLMSSLNKQRTEYDCKVQSMEEQVLCY